MRGRPRASAICALVASSGDEVTAARAGLTKLNELQRRFPEDGSVRVYRTIFKVLAGDPLDPQELERVVAEPDLATDLALLAQAQEGRTDALEAIELLASLVAKEPRFAAVRLVLAQLYWRLGRLDLAVREIDAAAEETPSAAASYARARLALQLGDLDRTVKELESCVDRDANGSTLSVLADVLWRQGKSPEAVAALKRACQLRPKDARLQDKLGEPND